MPFKPNNRGRRNSNTQGRGGFSGARGRGGSYGGRGRGGTRGRGGFKRPGSWGGSGSKRGRFSRGGPMKNIVVKHRHEGVFIIRGKEDSLATLNFTPGESVYSEKRVEVKVQNDKNEDQTQEEKIEYRVWNPFRSKLGSAILGGLDKIWIRPGTKVLYLGAASGTTVSHCSDIVGEKGLVFAVEFSHRSGRDLINVAKKRRNIVPIIEDARHPLRYRMLVGMVDTIFSDVAQPDQTRIVELNARYFLKNDGHLVMSIKANCVDSTAAPEAVFAQEVAKLKEWRFKPQEQVTLEPYERDHAVVFYIRKTRRQLYPPVCKVQTLKVVATYRPSSVKKNT